MRIAATRQLSFLAYKHNMTPSELSDKIIKRSKELNIVEDTRDNWGISVDTHLSEAGIPIKPLYKFIFGDPGNQYDLKNFSELVTIGDGNCPECGGEMIFKDGEFKQDGQFDYDNEPEYTPVWEKYECSQCGHIECSELNN